jgi:hypothetical protein
MWFNIAAAQTGGTRIYPVKSAVEGRELAARMMKQEEIDRAQELARNWKPRTRISSGQGLIPRK